MRALSTRNSEPERASRPFDKDRAGFVMGEGCGLMVLESLEHAQRRGVRIYAELVGYGMSADAYHITLPALDGAVRSMRLSLEDAKMAPSEVEYVNAHGTSTPAGDLERDPGSQAGLWRARQEAGGQLHQVHDRAPPGRRRGDRVGHHRSHPLQGNGAAHHQL